MVEKILPRSTEVSAPYWQGCREYQLRLQRCDACSTYQFYPRIMCANCGGRDVGWRDASGRGRIASFTVVRRGISAAYEAPYVVALIDLSEGPRMMSQIVDTAVDDERLVVGAAVQVDFEAWSEDITMPVFRLAD